MANERKKRYERNGTSVSPADNEILASKKVCVIGCGGLGGHIAEMLLRVGVIRLTLIDPDVFDETNLNRQLFSTEDGVGKPKVVEAEARLLAVDSSARLRLLQARLDASNAEEMLAGHDVVVDALDNIGSRRVAAKACDSLGIPFVHGAIGGWYAQVSVIMPESSGLEPLYGNTTDGNVDKTLGNMPFVAGFAACMQCAETVKLLLGKSPNLQGSIARVDLMNYEFDVF
ncbi:MAG: HesA/MoeB/ThiF family protein [Defluviitaleaceae bacterium]|nr:HesA/MoeB/ThiF family protein [Defluviitaleaceae bacterium]